ncbi:MAG: fused MFS/spermidine synthase [Bacteroidota bacterium]
MTQGPYHLIPLGILLILTYLGSMLSVRLQMLDRNRHRQIWNAFLLLFFFSSSMLGLFLAIKVNYKLNIPWIDKAMQWHVDMGIGLAFVAIFHLTWHLGYYRRALNILHARHIEENLLPFLDYKPIQVRILFLLLGFITMITQLVLLREYIKSLHGNELVIGIFLALWMVLTALGARAGSVYKPRISGPTLLKTLVILSGFPVVIYLLLVFLTRFILPPGMIPGILSSLSYMLLIIPFTLVSGFLFSYFTRAVRGQKVDATFYMLDALGSLAGGILFGLVLVFLFNNIQVILLLFIITALILVIFFSYPGGFTVRITIILAALLTFGAALFPGVRNGLESLRFKDERILETKDTPHGNISYTSRDGLVTGYLDMNPVISSNEPALCEEQVHYPALQRTHPESFLLIGGGLAGLETEVAKYDPKVFDYCEANRWMYRLGEKHLQTQGRHRFIEMDGRSWLIRSDTASYDVIISTACEPLTLGWNRYFTVEFYRLVKSHLNPGGVFSMQMPAGGNYINDTGSEQLGITYNTLKKVFNHVTIIPGYATFFLASEQPLSLDIPFLLHNHPIQTVYVHPDFLDASRMAFERDLLLERMSDYKGTINSDLRPVLFFKSLTSWNIKTDGNRLFYIFLLSLFILILLLFSYSRRYTGMFVAGFTGSGMQIVMIMVAQSFYGFAYLVTPLMISLFMGGLVAGAMLWKVIWKDPATYKTTVIMWILALVGAGAVVLLNMEQLFHRQWIGMSILGLLNFIPGAVVGSVYGILLSMRNNNIAASAGRLYSADLAGAAMGCLIPPLFLVPLIGVSNTFILFCGINVAAGLYLQSGKRQQP